jgi:hypothetical protein
MCAHHTVASDDVRAFRLSGPHADQDSLATLVLKALDHLAKSAPRCHHTPVQGCAPIEGLG